MVGCSLFANSVGSAVAWYLLNVLVEFSFLARRWGRVEVHQEHGLAVLVAIG